MLHLNRENEKVQLVVTVSLFTHQPANTTACIYILETMFEHQWGEPSLIFEASEEDTSYQAWPSSIYSAANLVPGLPLLTNLNSNNEYSPSGVRSLYNNLPSNPGGACCGSPHKNVSVYAQALQ